MKALQKKMSNDSLILFDDFKQVWNGWWCSTSVTRVDTAVVCMCVCTQRLVVLRKLAYISEDDAVALKGRVAAEISTAEELVLTELLFEGALADLTPAEAVSLLSALVFQVLLPCLRTHCIAFRFTAHLIHRVRVCHVSVTRLSHVCRVTPGQVRRRAEPTAVVASRAGASEEDRAGAGSRAA